MFLESFDHRSAAQGNWKWNIPPPGYLTTGRTGNGQRWSASDGWPTKTFGTDLTKMTIGVAYNTSGYAGGIRISGPNNSSGNACEISLGHVTDGRLIITFAGSGAAGNSGPSTFVLSMATWYYLELQVELTQTVNAHCIASARVNGAEILTMNYTDPTPNIYKINRFQLIPPGGGLEATFDDLYVTDDEFLGDIRIGVLYPNAVGDIDDWTPSGAGDNWQQVKEHTPDADTSYVSAGGTGLKDLYNIDDIDPAFTGAIKGVQALWAVKKSDEGDAAVKGVWKSGSTEITQTHGHNYLAPYGYHPSAASYSYNIQPERKSLFTAGDWTASEISSLQQGIIRTL